MRQNICFMRMPQNDLQKQPSSLEAASLEACTVFLPLLCDRLGREFYERGLNKFSLELVKSTVSALPGVVIVVLATPRCFSTAPGTIQHVFSTSPGSPHGFLYLFNSSSNDSTRFLYVSWVFAWLSLPFQQRIA